ncbi:hypothetical protein F5879DRAFT_158444 [Lentinula edodes]|uniref:Uncharacterized protein n=1 Tax=Lentinula lateritia TaxID=40482 RepID=A0A9W8ZZL0_9AGAR|nr:uncharacterized protein C8R40DRAFT_1084501 [Lentinula edodes]KAJ3933274.1 MAG: hypothetical protein NXY57DRAFT_39601 [Lentinula lateritia]KAF8823677.1 hypothetical protein HHX47_DHR9000520 [Lentinula edodes]KAH7880101.1 hypothetical protein C8R40DRAFT_1084501 [Lentinula edodes]KAJ3873238.1 hypothetical protein F5051DRAFT_381308 [Lentinula edodes]KAJ3887542.1 hypothetical protein GG344DRAFT_55515 [Lentinula edodes]
MNYDLNTYVAVTLAPNSPFLGAPSSLSTVHPALTHVGQVGQLHDVQLVSVPKEDWSNIGDDILASLKGSEGVSSVSVQELRQRTKRGGDEL